MAVIKDLVEIGKQLNHMAEKCDKLDKRYDGLHVSWYTKNKEIEARLQVIEQTLKELKALPKKRWWM